MRVKSGEKNAADRGRTIEVAEFSRMRMPRTSGVQAMTTLTQTLEQKIRGFLEAAHAADADGIARFFEPDAKVYFLQRPGNWSGAELIGAGFAKVVKTVSIDFARSASRSSRGCKFHGPSFRAPLFSAPLTNPRTPIKTRPTSREPVCPTIWSTQSPRRGNNKTIEKTAAE